MASAVGDALSGDKKKLKDYAGKTAILKGMEEREGMHGPYAVLELEIEGETVHCSSGGIPAEQAATLRDKGLLPAELKIVLFTSSFGGVWPRFEEA